MTKTRKRIVELWPPDPLAPLERGQGDRSTKTEAIFRAILTIPLVLVSTLGCARYSHWARQPEPEPCVGPDLAFYGHKKTCWRPWPNLEWSQVPCVDSLPPTLEPGEEIDAPPNVQVEPATFQNSSPAPPSQTSVLPASFYAIPQRLPPPAGVPRLDSFH